MKTTITMILLACAAMAQESAPATKPTPPAYKEITRTEATEVVENEIHRLELLQLKLQLELAAIPPEAEAVTDAVAAAKASFQKSGGLWSDAVETEIGKKAKNSRTAQINRIAAEMKKHGKAIARIVAAKTDLLGAPQ
jgi:hypothetical protein